MEKRNVYKGHRYVPKIMGVWDQLKTYEGLSIVLWEGTSYTSKKRVPEGVDISNEEYWAVTGNYNAQVEQYRQDVNSYRDEVEDYQEETDAQLAQIMHLEPNGVDDTDEIRAALAKNKRVRLLKTEEPFKINRAIVWSGDDEAFENIDIEGVGGVVDIVNISDPSQTDSSINSGIRPNADDCKSFRLRNLRFIGNWDGVTDFPIGDYATGIGVWLTPSDNYIADIHNVTCENFNEYGHYLYSKRANLGTIYANKNKVQGVAITNVAEELNIDRIYADDNGIGNDHSGAGLDIEYSASRPIGIKNVFINKVSCKRNHRGVVITTGSATDSHLDSHGLDYNDFNVNINEIYTEDSVLDGTIIDFPNVHIGNITSMNDNKKTSYPSIAGVTIRSPHPVTKNSLTINSILTVNAYRGCYFTGNVDTKYKNLNIGSVVLLDSEFRNLTIDSKDWVVSGVIENLIDESNKETTLPSLNTGNLRVIRGKSFGSPYQNMSTFTQKIILPRNLDESIEFKVPINSIIEEITVNIKTPSSSDNSLRIRVGGSQKAEIKSNVGGVRVLGKLENSLKTEDRSLNPIGEHIFTTGVRVEPLTTAITGDYNIEIFIKYSSL